MAHSVSRSVYVLDGRVFESRWVEKVFLTSKKSRPALRSHSPLSSFVSGVISLELSGRGVTLTSILCRG